MRVIALAAFACGLMFAALPFATSPARAQTYDPAYPICKKVSGDPTYFDCRYTSMGQCKEDVRAMSAECLTNPYFKGAHAAAPKSTTRR